MLADPNLIATLIAVMFVTAAICITDMVEKLYGRRKVTYTEE